VTDAVRPLLERLIRISEREQLRVTVEQRRSRMVLVRFGLRVRRTDGVEVDTPAFTLEPNDVRRVARALADVADDVEAGR
jgi:hypothetical protein